MRNPMSNTDQARTTRIGIILSAAILLAQPFSALAETNAVKSPSPDDQGAMRGMELQPMAPPATASATSPVPPLTDADRNAVYHGPQPNKMGDNEINYFFLFDQLEWQNVSGGSAFNWNESGWIGGDLNRLWITSEGKRSNKGLEEAEVQGLWGHSISPWWDLVAGVRQDFKPGKGQTFAAVGLQGLALSNFEAAATAYVGQSGQTSARLEGSYDLLITNRLILQPYTEINVYGKNDAGRGLGAGLSSTSVALRLRYEVNRQLAPYIGVTWDRTYGNTARFAEQEGQRRNEVSFVAGVRMWF
jgi:copper resistance protein B